MRQKILGEIYDEIYSRDIKDGELVEVQIYTSSYFL